MFLRESVEAGLRSGNGSWGCGVCPCAYR